MKKSNIIEEEREDMEIEIARWSDEREGDTDRRQEQT